MSARQASRSSSSVRPVGQHGVVEQQRARLRIGQARLAVVLALVVGVEQAGEEVGDVVAAQVDAGVEPGLGAAPAARARPRRCWSASGNVPSAGERGELLGVPLLDHAEAAELALDAVEVAVVVGVAGDEAVAADAVVGLDPLDDMHRERQPRDPGLAVALVLQIELGGRRVLDTRFGAEVVDRS